jgi:predicted nucleic acid-binding Zn ribbon protein
VVQDGLPGLFAQERSGALMPLKDYQCMECGTRTERQEGITNAPDLPPFCTTCGNRMVWAPRSMTFALKGSGWTPKGNTRGTT